MILLLNFCKNKKEIEITPNTKIRFLKPKEDENENKIIYLKQKDSDNEIKTIHNLKPQKEEEIIILQQKQETENSPIIHQKEKINGNLLITASPRRYPQISRINKDEDDNLNKVEETNVKLPSLIKPKKTQFNPSNYGISINEFNSYALQQQLQVIKSKIISINSSTSISKNRIQFFKNIYKTLNYIIRLVNSPETSNYFLGIQTENLEDKFDNVCESNQVVFFYNATELLYEKELLESNEVREFFKLFKHVSIEIKYFSKSFRSIYDTVFEMSHVKIQIFFTGMKKTDITFKGDKHIRTIRFDNTVNCIGDYAFKNCLSLKQVFIPSSVTSIGSGSFEGCCSLKSISIPSSVTSIGFSVFKGCSDLTEVLMHNSIKLIRSNAFNGCSSLSQISLPSSITSIDDFAFFDCAELKVINIPASVMFIGQFAFSKCVALHSIIIPSSVKSIGKSAFKGCDALEKLSIPSSIKNVNQLDIKTGCKISTL